jgi:hypothetical protein
MPSLAKNEVRAHRVPWIEATEQSLQGYNRDLAATGLATHCRGYWQ